MSSYIHTCRHEKDGGPPGLSCGVYGVRDNVGGAGAGTPLTGRLGAVPGQSAVAAWPDGRRRSPGDGWLRRAACSRRPWPASPGSGGEIPARTVLGRTGSDAGGVPRGARVEMDKGNVLEHSGRHHEDSGNCTESERIIVTRESARRP